jgi:HrpA-like RNA helicase
MFHIWASFLGGGVGAKICDNFVTLSRMRISLVQALSQLHTLGAIDHSGYITSLGRQMSSFPLEPNLARMLIESATRYVCVTC